MSDKLSSVFSDIARDNVWGSQESISGTGSTVDVTAYLRQELFKVFCMLGVQSIVDAPCGDMNWMRHLNYPFKKYIGIDIVPAIVQKLRDQEFPAFYHFQVGNIVTDILPKADVIFCRDCLVHLPLDYIHEAKRLWQLAGFKYVFVTTFPDFIENTDIEIGEWRALNMEIAPFFWGKPKMIIDEKAGIAPPFHCKSIGVWEL